MRALENREIYDSNRIFFYTLLLFERELKEARRNFKLPDTQIGLNTLKEMLGENNMIYQLFLSEKYSEVVHIAVEGFFSDYLKELSTELRNP